MRFYEVFAAEAGYQKQEPLTYAYEGLLLPGAVVAVPFGRKVVSGFMLQEVEEPTFKTKPIAEVYDLPSLPTEVLELHAWIAKYYPSGSGAVTQLFVPSGLSTAHRQTKARSKKQLSNDLPALTKEQQAVLAALDKSPHKTALLHGETGSGKTRVYLERARTALAAGNSALILVPEISLVPQTAALFEKYFDDQVVVMHSGLTKATRNKNWRKILVSSEPLIVIGTRSALFSPLRNLGFIAIDEMHEPAYKQESGTRYYALRVAAYLAKLHKAELVYGSATPPVTEYFIAEQTSTPILRMESTAKDSGTVKRQLVDLRDSKSFARHRYLSDNLLAALELRLQRSEQSLLFLNRRGTFRAVLCGRCGWQALCPKCDLPLTYHGDAHQMRCHTCGYHAVPPYHCPTCGSDDIAYRSLGTKALVDDLVRLFPEARIQRFDTDNLAAEQLGRHFEAVQTGKIDILVGTQMLGKGLDLPRLSLVGIVNADTSLSTPDFSANERSYQLLHQAIGRVGRGHLDGEVIVQSFNPENPTLVAALNQKWHRLYKSEVAEREQFGFPPFYFLLKITVSRKTSAAAEQYIGRLRSTIRELPLRLRVDEATPSFYERSHGSYNWQLIIRAKNRGQLLAAIAALPAGDFTYDLDPLNLL